MQSFLHRNLCPECNNSSPTALSQEGSPASFDYQRKAKKTRKLACTKFFTMCEGSCGVDMKEYRNG
jgi:hypothetical protein